MSTPIATIGDTPSPSAPKSPPTGGIFSGKRWIIALFIIAGVFFAYVLWQRGRQNQAATTAVAGAAGDASVVDQAALENSQIAQLSQQITSGQAQTGAQLSAINSNVSGSRQDASVGLNGINALLNRARGNPPPTPAPKPTPNPPPPKAAIGTPARPIQALTSSSSTAPVSSKYGHLNTV